MTHLDLGAHFYKCDFQVHTPRDANWSGQSAVTPADRKAYAENLIRACRSKGLDAIAITDHHDFAFFPFIKDAADLECDENGQRLAAKSRIIVFPGIELTLSSPPCQAILLLDADFDKARLSDILTVLAITPVDPSRSSLPSVTPISPNTITNLNDLEDKLNQQTWLKGKFIILPNVTDGGHKSFLREGFHQHYKEMHCVGGYIDGSYERTSLGKRAILEGRQQNQGYRPIGVIQTSDNRSHDHAALGSHATYVKWSEPTAEAIRQACLARESRLSLQNPLLPDTFITTLTVSDSTFLGRVSLDFNQQYNVLIGGRGTGKSTILEYLRFGLCDQSTESEDNDLVQMKRTSLIAKTLRSRNAMVHVEFVVNGLAHVARRDTKNGDLAIKIGSHDFRPATEEQIQALLPIQAYSQKQLSSVGVRIDELRRFVELPVRHELEELQSDARDVQAKLRAAYSSYRRFRELKREIVKDTSELQSLGEQLAKLRIELKGLSEDDKHLIASKVRFDNDKFVLETLREDLERARLEVAALASSLSNSIRLPKVDEDVEFANPDLLNSIVSAYDSKHKEISALLKHLINIFQESPAAELESRMKEWEALFSEFEQQYEAAQLAASANQVQLEQILSIDKRLVRLRKSLSQKTTDISTLQGSEAEVKQQRERWSAILARRASVVESQCSLLLEQSGGFIRASLKGQLNLIKLSKRLKAAFSGMNVREDKIDSLCNRVATAGDVAAEWNAVVAELEIVALHDVKASNELPQTPILNSCSFIETERRRIATSFDPERWIEVALTELEFVPLFEYCTNQARGEYISFKDASAGQQATALLTVLLTQVGSPLIIDQPEDDIDSKLFRELVTRVWRAKGRRQLIFSSHSANFVVNGDAELVVCCDYTRAGDQTQGKLKSLGAIDNAVIKEEIILVTEGGRDAFKLRMDQYGF